MELGTRIYYEGDTANRPGHGEVAAVKSADNFQPDRVDVKLDDGRVFNGIPLSMFKPQSGRRFLLESEWKEQREADLVIFRERFRQEKRD